MKKQFLLILLFLFGFTRYNAGNYIEFENSYDITKETEVKHTQNELDRFLDDLGFKESGNRYHVVNRYGYLGKYQFSKKTLNGLGYNVTKTEFLSSPHLQEQAMLDLLSHNKKILYGYIDYWDGRVVHGTTITESGILAAAHLAGPTNVKNFFKHGKDFKDGNGTPLTKYLTKFSGYNIEIEAE